MSVVIRLHVDLAETDRGGRRRPVRDGYRASLSFGRRRRDVEPIVHDAVLVFEDVDELQPGASAVARAWMFDELPRRGVDDDAVIALLEQDRIIGRARVLSAHEDETLQPLADLADAKRRPL
ncbi:hypothetical protein C8N24_0797 [Solirubrobacter pauli]|uniref:Uncharacterized protein n=1 Tax=Solirubrobacter pauli TaxID=166793 RepID=A0A660LDZ8_9ACTN|nr:hypothetical protein [Solirubrobacter pauli]RKQ90981.1 hypothetical protein C8N24_0797 [Solirubrobacter pauli]